MALTTAYLVTTKNLEEFLNAIQTAQAPERFTQKFLKELEFTSANDRLFIGLLKGLGFIEDSGTPTQRYFDFLDQTQSKKVLAQALRVAYEDLFRVNKEAFKLSEAEAKNKLKTLTRGEKSENVLAWMAKTFKALSDYADWSKTVDAPAKPMEKVTPDVPEKKETPTGHGELKTGHLGLHYNVQIHLPATRDPAVYEAIFKSLRDHLLQ